MDKEMRSQLKALLINHEGYREKPYVDTAGKLSIGVGRNLTDVGLFEPEITLMLNNDIDYFYNWLNEAFPWFSELNQARQIALVDMCFMGTKKFLTFKRMIDALSQGNFLTAANEIIHSKYHKQVGKRAEDIARIIKTGKL